MLETLREGFGIFKTMRSVGKNESGKFGGLQTFGATARMAPQKWGRLFYLKNPTLKQV